MDENYTYSKEFSHLLKLALIGDQKGITSFARRVARQARDSEPAFSQGILGLLKNSRDQPATRALRDSASSLVPVDRESRQHLVRIEDTTSVVADPVLPENVMRQVEQIVLERKNISKLKKAGLEPSRTILFSGAPGVGKTLTARWIASKLKRPLFCLDLSSVMSSFLGRTGSNLKSVLEFAKTEDGILLLDEFDTIAKRRDDDTEVGELKRLVTVLLQEIDLWPSDRLLIAATNHGELLDTAVWRRFDMVVQFPMPGPDHVMELLRREIGNGVEEKWIKAFSVALKDRSFGDINVDVRKMRRQSVLQGTPITEAIVTTIKSALSNLTKRDLKNLAIELHGLGFSQRYVSEVTGLARDTLRELSVEWSKNEHGR